MTEYWLKVIVGLLLALSALLGIGLVFLWGIYAEIRRYLAIPRPPLHGPTAPLR